MGIDRSFQYQSFDIDGKTIRLEGVPWLFTDSQEAFPSRPLFLFEHWDKVLNRDERDGNHYASPMCGLPWPRHFSICSVSVNGPMGFTPKWTLRLEGKRYQTGCGSVDITQLADWRLAPMLSPCMSCTVFIDKAWVPGDYSATLKGILWREIC